MANWKTNYTDMEELEKIFRNWYMDLLDNKEYIHGLLQDKATKLHINYEITAKEVPTMTISVEKLSY